MKVSQFLFYVVLWISHELIYCRLSVNSVGLIKRVILDHSRVSKHSEPSFRIAQSYGRISVLHKSGESVHFHVDRDEIVVQKHAGKLAVGNTETIDGIFGFFKLPAGYYIATIANSSAVDYLSLPGVRKVDKIRLIKLPVLRADGNAQASSELQLAVETLLLKTVRQHALYFSTGRYDITRTFQSNTLQDISSTECGALPDERFFWNMNNLHPLLSMRNQCRDFIVPTVNAWIAQEDIKHRGSRYKMMLISRRSRRRQGPRYIKRGSDELGDVANFVETEQILSRADGSASSSFLQVSIKFCYKV